MSVCAYRYRTFGRSVGRVSLSMVVVACLMKHATKTIRMITHLVYLHHMRWLGPPTTTTAAAAPKNGRISQLQGINCLLSRILFVRLYSLDSKCAMRQFHASSMLRTRTTRTRAMRHANLFPVCIFRNPQQ